MDSLVSVGMRIRGSGLEGDADHQVEHHGQAPRVPPPTPMPVTLPRSSGEIFFGDDADGDAADQNHHAGASGADRHDFSGCPAGDHFLCHGEGSNVLEAA